MNTPYVTLICFVAAVGGFLFGYDLVIVTGANEFLKEQFQLSDIAFGFTTSSAMIGCILGPFLGFWLCDSIGRKNTLILSGALFGVSAIMTAIPADMVTFNLFRVVGGLGVGLSSLASPMYIAEVAPPRMRGRLGIMYQLAIVTGATISAVVAYLLANNLAETVSWRWMFASELVAIVIFLACLITVPKSPRWLAEKGRFEEAHAVLTKIVGLRLASAEIEEIKGDINREEGSWSELFGPGMRTALLVGCLLALFNNLTGWTAMAYYMPSIFRDAGIETKAESLAWYSGVNLCQIGLTVLALCLIDRLGRRPLWIFGSIFMACTMTLIGGNFILGFTGAFAFLFVMILFSAIPHALALGSIPWFMMSELFATRLRAKAVMITTTVIWCAGFTAGQFMPILMGAAKRITGTVGPAFLVFSVICILSLIFGIRILPETKGRTLEEIARSWTK
jgi:SP family arabinose:H+ symporter-like MFS transporter